MEPGQAEQVAGEDALLEMILTLDAAGYFVVVGITFAV
jgi:hypothetical protein